jgi:hypothetical protein
MLDLLRGASQIDGKKTEESALPQAPELLKKSITQKVKELITEVKKQIKEGPDV